MGVNARGQRWGARVGAGFGTGLQRGEAVVAPGAFGATRGFSLGPRGGGGVGGPG